MADRVDTDVVIGGGGIAGSAAAIALGRSGLRVMLVEPMLRDDRRCGGEILHPRGLANLTELGLDAAALGAQGVAIDAFHVWEHQVGDVELAYAASAQGAGLAIEHARLHAALFAAAGRCPNVTVVRGMKVAGIVDHPGSVDVAIAGKGGGLVLRARLLVGADGSRSQIRRLAGIACRSESASMVSMASVPSHVLPDSRCAHLFVGGDRIAFAYPIGGARARVMVDHASGAVPSPQAVADLLPAGCPDPIGSAMRERREDPGLHRFLTSLVSVGRPCRGHTVLAGDASGSCHPLTASGMTAATSDALSLATAMVETSGDLGVAARAHVARRKSRQLSRLVLATLLHEIYTDATPRSIALRRAMVGDWRSVAGQAHAMSLLSMADDGPHRLLHGMARILCRGLGQWRTQAAAHDTIGELLTGARASKTVFRYGAALLANSYRMLGSDGRVVS